MTNTLTKHDLVAAMVGVTNTADDLLVAGVHMDAVLVALGQKAAEQFQMIPEADRTGAMAAWCRDVAQAAGVALVVIER